MKRGGLAVPILNEAGQPVGIASTTKFHSPAVFPVATDLIRATRG